RKHGTQPERAETRQAVPEVEHGGETPPVGALRGGDVNSHDDRRDRECSDVPGTDKPELGERLHGSRAPGTGTRGRGCGKRIRDRRGGGRMGLCAYQGGSAGFYSFTFPGALSRCSWLSVCWMGLPQLARGDTG